MPSSAGSADIAACVVDAQRTRSCEHKQQEHDVARSSLSATADGGSTMLVVDAGTDAEHVMVALQGVLVGDMADILQSRGHHGIWGW